MPYMGGWAVCVLELLGLDERGIELVTGGGCGRPPVAGRQRVGAPQQAGAAGRVGAAFVVKNAHGDLPAGAHLADDGGRRGQAARDRDTQVDKASALDQPRCVRVPAGAGWRTPVRSH
jgi:hypothetical protein